MSTLARIYIHRAYFFYVLRCLSKSNPAESIVSSKRVSSRRSPMALTPAGAESRRTKHNVLRYDP